MSGPLAEALRHGLASEHAERGRKPFVWLTAVTFICCLLVLPVLIDHRMPTPTVDAAHHYALIRHLMDFGWRSTYYAHLGEMSTYPPLAHYIAAFVGLIYGNTFTAMLVVAYGAVLLTYASLTLITARISVLAATFVLSIFGLTKLFSPDLTIFHGAEIQRNFLYSQLVGFALAYAALAALACFRLRSPAVSFAMFLIVQTIAFSHLMPALHLAGAYGLLLLSDWLRKRNTRAGLSTIFYAVGLVAMLAFHPSMNIMTELAGHQGGISFGFDLSEANKLTILFVCLTTSLALLLRDKRPQAAVLGAIGGSIALVTVAQMGLFASGFGSQYGIDKALIAASTIGVFTTCAVVATSLPCYTPSLWLRNLSIFALVACGVLIAFVQVLHGAWLNSATFLAYQEIVRGNIDRSVVQVSTQSDFGRELNYLVSIGDLRLPRDGRAGAVLSYGMSSEGVGQTFTREAAVPPECVLRKLSTGVVLADTECVISRR